MKSPTIVQREFLTFFKVTPRKQPHVQEIQRIIHRFQKTGNVTPLKAPGLPKTLAEKISAVKTDLDSSICQVFQKKQPRLLTQDTSQERSNVALV